LCREYCKLIIISIYQKFVACQFATICFGRGRGQEVLLMLAGLIDRCSKIGNKQDNARHMTSRRAHPAVTFFGTLISRSFSFVCVVNQFTFSFTFGFRLVFFLRFHLLRVSLCRVSQPVLGRLE
jgi:hypothetical protein